MMRTVLVLVAWLAGSAALHADDYLWFEGESASETNFPTKSDFSPGNDVERAVLSGGNWLSNSGKRAATEPEAFAIWHIDVPDAGEYALWTRKFWKHGPFRWRFDDQLWQTCGRDVALADSSPIRTHVVANWVFLGKVRLDAGQRKLEIRLLAAPGEEKTSAFDCFILTRAPFSPAGKLKPGERTGRAEDGFFSWEPAPDPFNESPLDLRFLNEPVAGVNGRVRLGRDGNDLALGDGTPVRFWGVNVALETAIQDHASIDYLARRLAKLGVNAVRFHSAMWKPDDPRVIDPRKLDALHYLVHALKQQGIYTTLSFYFPLWLDAQKAGLEGFAQQENKKPFGLIFFDPKLQAIHRGWMKQILEPLNPYTRLPMARDPALAMIELVNEDSLLFWTFTRRNIPDLHWRRLEQRFGGKLEEAWGMTSDAIKNDDARRQRMGRQVKFLAGLQRDFYTASKQYLSRELGYDGLVIAGNWTTADGKLLDAAERWSYAALDVIDRHGYFDGKHEGEGSGYSVRVGHRYTDRTALTDPGSSPLVTIQTAGRPQVISEINWNQPNRFRAEMTWLAAVLASAQGLDGLFFFAIDNAMLRSDTINKFQLASPAILGTFPAAALAYRRGDIPTPPPVFVRSLPGDTPFALQPEDVTDPSALDALRAADLPKSGEQSRPDGKAVRAAGPLLRRFDPKASTGVHRSAKPTWHFDRERRIATVIADRVVGAAGDLRAGIALGDVKLTTSNDRLHLLLVSLDDQPVRSSRRLLVQSITEDMPFGFRAEQGVIRELGIGPMNVRKIDATLHLTSDRSVRITTLDENGYPRGEPRTVEPVDGTVSVRLPEDAIHALVER